MLKRTLLFGNPAYLSTKDEQLVVKYPDNEETKKVPIEDIGILVLEHSQITITNSLLAKLTQNKTAVITCDSSHLPIGFLQPLVGHTEQTERMRHQIQASIPLKKQLWQQTVSAKIKNQALHLTEKNIPCKKMYKWTNEVKTGDAENHESRAAVFYWENIFGIENFVRGQKEISPNHFLNYGYAILRAVVARALVRSGMLPSLGIFHRNKYNAYCLADDVMEPYRPFVDAMVFEIVKNTSDNQKLNPEIKQKLLQIPVMDVKIDHKKSPLMHAVSRTTHSLYECFEGSKRKLLYPVYE